MIGTRMRSIASRAAASSTPSWASSGARRAQQSEEDVLRADVAVVVALRGGLRARQHGPALIGQALVHPAVYRRTDGMRGDQPTGAAISRPALAFIRGGAPRGCTA